MRLQAELPARIAQARLDRPRGVLLQPRAVHRLKRAHAEFQPGQRLQVESFLRDHDLDLVAASHDELRPRLRAYADPVEVARRHDRAIGLHGDEEMAVLERIDQLDVRLQQRLAAGEDDEACARIARWPERGRRFGEARSVELPAAASVGAHELGVAEPAHGCRAVLFAPAPQVAAREAAEHGGAARVGALTLQRVEHLLDGVWHGLAMNWIPAHRCTAAAGMTISPSPRRETRRARARRTSPAPRSCTWAWAPSTCACGARARPWRRRAGSGASSRRS